MSSGGVYTGCPKNELEKHLERIGAKGARLLFVGDSGLTSYIILRNVLSGTSGGGGPTLESLKALVNGVIQDYPIVAGKTYITASKPSLCGYVKEETISGGGSSSLRGYLFSDAIVSGGAAPPEHFKNVVLGLMTIKCLIGCMEGCDSSHCRGPENGKELFVSSLKPILCATHKGNLLFDRVFSLVTGYGGTGSSRALFLIENLAEANVEASLIYTSFIPSPLSYKTQIDEKTVEDIVLRGASGPTSLEYLFEYLNIGIALKLLEKHVKNAKGLSVYFLPIEESPPLIYKLAKEIGVEDPKGLNPLRSSTETSSSDISDIVKSLQRNPPSPRQEVFGALSLSALYCTLGLQLNLLEKTPPERHAFNIVLCSLAKLDTNKLNDVADGDFNRFAGHVSGYGVFPAAPLLSQILKEESNLNITFRASIVAKKDLVNRIQYVRQYSPYHEHLVDAESSWLSCDKCNKDLWLVYHIVSGDRALSILDEYRKRLMERYHVREEALKKLVDTIDRFYNVWLTDMKKRLGGAIEQQNLNDIIKQADVCKKNVKSEIKNMLLWANT